MPDDVGRIQHQLDHDLGDQLAAHGLYVGVIAFVIIIGLVLTLLVIADVRGRRRERRAWAARAAAEDTTRAAGVDEGFRRGWHG